jgi:hypothetical protein
MGPFEVFRICVGDPVSMAFMAYPESATIIRAAAVQEIPFRRYKIDSFISDPPQFV